MTITVRDICHYYSVGVHIQTSVVRVMTTIDISILTPTYERMLFLPYLALMIGTQTNIDLKAVEWVVVDDSQCNHAHWFRTHALQCALGKVTYVHLPHKQTIGCKRNLVKTLACGKYMIHMDDDDYYAPNYVSTVMSMFHSKRKPRLIGATSIFLMFPDSLYLSQSGPFRQNHSCGGALSYTREYAHKHHFDNQVKIQEEPSFIQNNDMMQIQNAFNINMVFVHDKNTVSKDHLKRKQIQLRWIDVIQHPTILHFYMSMHAKKLPFEAEIPLFKTARSNYGYVFYAMTVIKSLQELVACLIGILHEHTTSTTARQCLLESLEHSVVDTEEV